MSRLRLLFCCILAGFLALSPAVAQSNLNLRVMSANLNGNIQNYQPFALRIFQGLKPDVVAIQEFNYTSTNGLGANTPAAFREMVDTAFGTQFSYAREVGSYNIPNGIISRYPILTNGTWDDPLVNDRGLAWALIDLPGSNDLYVVSVHLYSGGTTTDRNTEATTIKTHIQNEFPANAWVVVAGDMNTDTRSEPAIGTFTTFLSDSPQPSDAESGGNKNTNANRNKPYDYVLPSFSLATYLTNVVFASHSFSNGLVFDSAVYTPLSDVSPVQSADSGNAQHMGVLKNFLVPVAGSNTPPAAPQFTLQPQDRTTGEGSTVSFTAAASGSPAPTYQWRWYGTNLAAANSTSLTLSGVQLSQAGPYSVVAANASGSVTSSVATLTVTSAPPSIATQPQPQSVFASQSATFSVTANGSAPLGYQWRFGITDIPGATGSSYTRTNVQPADGGNYFVVVTNASGSVTSSAALLTVLSGNASVIAQWDYSNTNAVTTNSPLPSLGTGTSSVIGGTSGSWVSGAGSVDPGNPNNAWNTAPYPAVSAGNKTAGAQFNVSTSGRENIVIRWDTRISNTGSKYARLQYTTNGTTFIDYPSSVSVSAGAVFEPKTNSLAGFPGVANNPNFAFRIVTEFQSTATGSGTVGYVAANTGSTYGTAGTVRFDMVTVSGSVIAPNNPPPSPATLSASALDPNGTFHFLVTGSAGSNYIVQATDSLSPIKWLSVATNASPFSYTNNNVLTNDQRFYRAVTQ